MYVMHEKQDISVIKSQARLHTTIHPGSKLLRRAIRRNLVSFPSQIPVFSTQPPDGMHWRIVLLFFVRGWSLTDIAGRFKVPTHRVCQILNFWPVRALALGYVEVIDPEAFAECCRMDVEFGYGRDSEDILLDESGPAPVNRPQKLPELAQVVHAAVALRPGKIGPGIMSNELPGNSAAVIDALDVAIAHCEEWGGQFWVRTTTLLRDLRAVAATALDPRQSIDQTDGRFSAFQGGKSNLKQESRVGEEEHISHAVA
jgi:hypothetical protein